jgi:hypothetical protein
MPEGTCFVVMGFGKKTDYQSGRTLDLDKSYRNMIKPAVEEAGLQCIRADEIKHSGIIDVPMYEQLLSADVVVADLSTSNCNACYELGVRHALRPYTTIIIAESQFKYPFDFSHIAIRSYQHLGEGLDFDEVVRFRGELKSAIAEIMSQPKNDSPVYEFLKQLRPPKLEELIEAASADGQITAPVPVPVANDQTVSVLMSQVDVAFKQSNFLMAKGLLQAIRGLLPTDAYILQKLALATYKSKIPTVVDALQEARGVLLACDPRGSNDAETLGLWGAIHKRLWEETQQRTYLDESLFAYQKGFYLKNDYYNGINLAFLLNLSAALPGTTTADAITDYVLAQRTRRQVLVFCENLLAGEKERGKALPDHYWIAATMGEALTGLGDRERAKEVLDAAYADADAWMKESTEEQLKKLETLLAAFPAGAAVGL